MSAEDDDDNSTRGVTLAELQRRHVRAELAEGMHTMIPARVEKYDASTGMVDCVPLVKDFHRDETGALVVAAVPVVPSVPVMFLAAGGFVFTVPIQAGEDGTIGCLVFSERSLDRWLAGAGQVVDPELYSRFNLTDAVFIPGLAPFGAPIANVPTDHATAGSVAGARIHFRDATITIGDEAGSKAVGLNGDTCAVSAAMTTWMSNVAAGILAGGGGALTPLVGTAIATVTASATQAKAK